MRLTTLRTDIHLHIHTLVFAHTFVVIELATAVTSQYVMKAMNSRSKMRPNVNDLV